MSTVTHKHTYTYTSIQIDKFTITQAYNDKKQTRHTYKYTIVKSYKDIQIRV